MRAAPLFVLAAFAALALVSCGKAGRPLQPADSVYPRIYPDPQNTPATAAQKTGRALPPEWDQQDLKDRFTSNGSYIDPSTKVLQGSQNLPPAGLSNTTTSGSDPFNQNLGSSTPSEPAPSSSPTDSEDQQ
ncbi:hypothetical protein [Telmatospirillum sp.]|uniref:hypothetical protein n=1 Tax=Telmatospirillum sp. TaxID=2079197 RepID=UPI00283AEF58|nr:hypothetical protein [Telmatospirillum sp.]MDR3441157.1 hypothetical protein [Telmatospirillum sp.]